MSRLATWIDRPSQEQETDLEIVYDIAETVEVYRRIETGENTGFSDEVDEPLPAKSINARIDLSKSGEYTYLALSDDTDVLVNDRWLVSGNKGGKYFLVVKQVNYRKNISEVYLERE